MCEYKKSLLIISIIIVLFIAARCAVAEQIVNIEIVPTPTPKPVYKPVDDLPAYELDEKEVKILARLLWSSPLRSQSEKIKLLWVVFNRIDTGYPFGDSVESVVTKNEFTFYDRKARVSDKNRDIVEEEMRRWMAYKEGYGIGWHPPTNALYCRFVGNNNRQIELMSESCGKALTW